MPHKINCALLLGTEKQLQDSSFVLPTTYASAHFTPCAIFQMSSSSASVPSSDAAAAPAAAAAVPSSEDVDQRRFYTCMCQEKHLPDHVNVPRPHGAVAAVDPAHLVSHPRTAAQTSKKWPNGSVLRVKFLGGNTSQRNFVQRIANQWSNYANIRFAWVATGSAQIRVAFNTQLGSWSYVGTDALGIPANQMTLNLGWLSVRNQTPDDAGVVLHEFGHALGLVHEHQSPVDGGLQWNRPVVIAALSGPPNNWDLATITSNVFDQYARNQLTATAHLELTSIMMYTFPASWTTNHIATPYNIVLSAVDKQLARTLYPGRPIVP